MIKQCVNKQILNQTIIRKNNTHYKQMTKVYHFYIEQFFF
jgi:hypothetical protein